MEEESMDLAQNSIAQQLLPLGTLDPDHHDRDGPDDTEGYQYEALQSPSHIRILELEPGDQAVPLRCSLVQVDLKDKPHFEAISYAWGDASDLKTIECDGKELKITRSLHEALESFRFENYSRRLWADAICINQKDLPERASQVQLMAKIYSEALRVLLWLGRYDQHVIDTAFGFLDLFSSDERVEQWRREYALLRSQGTPFRFDQVTEDALRCLITRPVFRRGWIIQEVSLAHSVEVCWGSARMELSTFNTALIEAADELVIVSVKNPATENFFTLSSICLIRIRQQNGSQMNPMDLIHSIREFHFTDERDRIYGILALRFLENEQWPNNTFVQVDYTVTKWDAFRSFTEACLVREGSLATLLFTRSWDNTLGDQPSWACDWSRPDTDWSELSHESFAKYSCGDEHSTVKKVDQHRISIDGVSVTQLEALLDLHDIREPQSCLKYLWELFGAACVVATASALFSTSGFICGDAESPEEMQEVLTSACLEFLELDLTRKPLGHRLHKMNSKGENFGILCEIYLSGKMFFRSAQGKVGLGPRNIQQGDTIAVLFGSRGPDLSFVLRPAGEAWKLVGPCYMYDLKDGSAVKRWRESGEPKETFIIC